MENWNIRLKIGIGLLAAAMLLALAKPAVHLLTDPQGGSFGLHWDYGVPTQWYGNPEGGRPPGVRLPENSIGQDFLSLDTYIRCLGFGGPEMYQSYCAGDPFSRPFAYPPLLAAAFFWVIFFPTAAATAYWSLAVIALLIGSGIAWGMFPGGTGPERKPRSLFRALVPAFLLAVSYPAVFAFERGNTEALILLVLTLAGWCLARRFWFGVGFFTALAAVAKLYPWLTFMACLALGVWLLWNKENRQSGALLLAGSACGLLLPLGLMFRQHAHYFGKVLPFLSQAKLPDPDCSYCHSWPAAYEVAGYGLALVLGGLAILHFAVFARRFASEQKQADLVRCLISFAAGLGVSGNVPNTSYDYSLILLFPLMMMCMLWESPKRLDARGIGFGILLAGMIAPRWLEGLAWKSGEHSVFLAVQTLGWILVGWSLAQELVQVTKNKKLS